MSSDTPTDIEDKLTALLFSYAGTYDIRLLAGEARDELRALRADRDDYKATAENNLRLLDIARAELEQKDIEIEGWKEDQKENMQVAFDTQAKLNAARAELEQVKRIDLELLETEYANNARLAKAQRVESLHKGLMQDIEARLAVAEAYREKYLLLTAQHARLVERVYEDDGETLRHVTLETEIAYLKTELVRALADVERSDAETIAAHAREAALRESALPFIVQYRGKEYGTYPQPWKAMAAFDSQNVAEKYAADCSGENCPWEYRAVAARAGKEPDRG